MKTVKSVVEISGKKGRTYIAEIDAVELAVRLTEALSNVPRIPGWTAEFALQQLEDSDHEAAANMRLMAQTAILYLRECLEGGSLSQ